MCRGRQRFQGSLIHSRYKPITNFGGYFEFEALFFRCFWFVNAPIFMSGLCFHLDCGLLWFVSLRRRRQAWFHRYSDNQIRDYQLFKPCFSWVVFLKFIPFIFRPQTLMTRLNFDKPKIIGTFDSRMSFYWHESRGIIWVSDPCGRDNSENLRNYLNCQKI